MDDVSNNGGILQKTKILTVSTKVGYAANTQGKTSVFANTDISAGDVIEIVPYLSISQTCMTDKEIADHAFTINQDSKKYAIGLGLASLYQHNDKPNAEFHINEDREEIRFTAKEDIKKSEEITISYGKSYFLSREKSRKTI